jgi:magnesium chelatase family protein
MVSRVYTVAFQGVEVLGIDVQVQMGHDNGHFTIVGLPDKAVAESRERIRASFQTLGLGFPFQRITVNLAPADVQKEGSHYDLPMALGLMVAMGTIDAEAVSNYIALGELGLDGSLSAVSGILPAAVDAVARGYGLICPQACGTEALWAGDLEVLAAPNLLALVNHFKGTQLLPQPQRPSLDGVHRGPQLDLKDIKGQELGKRALEIAAAGGHNLLMVGPPGAGKSMLASRLPGILPPLTPTEALEVTMVHSIAGALPEAGIVYHRPFRDPHHSASLPALVGGGMRCRPGEISLAHNGVLFLDELPEFQRPTLESLRQPLETGRVIVARANSHVTYPARVQVVGAMNPCRCGYFGDPSRQCSRVPKCARDYQDKISGPMLDRFDLVLEIGEVKADDLVHGKSTVTSVEVSERVAHARDVQARRYKGHEGVRTNAVADGELLMAVAEPDEDGKQLLHTAVEKFKLSARGYHRVMRVSRTIADLAGAETVGRSHVAEALSFRRVGPTA